MTLVHGYDKTLYAKARVEARKAQALAESDDSGSATAGAAVAAIVLSEATLEAFVSEALAVYQMVGRLSSEEREEIRQQDGFYQTCKEFHDHFSEDSLHRKPVYSKSLVPLVKLRNCVIHRSAGSRDPDEWPDKIKDYRDIIDHVEGEELSWTSQLFTAETAGWAVWAAYYSRDVLHGTLPAESLREKFYREVSKWVLREPDVS